MKKSLVAAVLTIGFIGNAFASCDNTPYNSPEELQPSCAEEKPVVKDVETTSASKLKVNQEIDSKSERNTDATDNPVLEKPTQSSVK